MEPSSRRWRVADLIASGKLVIGDGYRAKNSELSAEGLPFARAGNVNDGFRFDGADRFPEEHLDRVGQKVSRPGDVVFTSKGTVGRFAYVQWSTPPFVYSPQLCFWRSLDDSVINPRFLYYWMYSREFSTQVRGVAGQTDMAEYVSLRDQRKMHVTLPGIRHQERVSEVLGALDDKIELNRRMNETLERMVEIQFTERFANSAIADGEHVPVSMLFTIVSGGTPKTTVEAYWDGTIPWFSVVDTPSGSDVFVVKTEKSITEAGLASSPARLVDPCTTIISARGTVGNLAMAAEPMTFNQSCYGLVATEATGPVFVHQLAKHVVERLRAMAHGSVFSTITRSTFDAVTFPRPRPDEVGAFEALARPMYERILTAVKESATLADLRDTLLPKLISGELRIPDAERLVNEVT